MKNRVFRAGILLVLLVFLILPVFADTQSMTLRTRVPGRTEPTAEAEGTQSNPRTGDAGPLPALLTAALSAGCLLYLKK